MLKRFLLLIMSAIMLTALCACENEPDEYTAGSDADTPSETASSSEPQSDPVSADGQLSSEDEPSSEPDPGPKIVTVTVTAAGDCTLGTNQKQSYSGSFDEIYDKNGAAYFLQNCAELFHGDDFTIVNLEGSLTNSTDIQTSYYNTRLGETLPKSWNHKGKPEYVEILTLGSVEGVSMANNHNMDYGQSGFDETVGTVENAGIVWACDESLGYYNVKGIRIGVVSVNEVYDGTELVERYLKNGIETLRESCDLVIVCAPWGREMKRKASDIQTSIGHNCIDWGADIVIGSHPHVIQGAEKYNGRYIFYSLGNFCFGSNKNPSDKDCIVVQQTFTFIDGELVTDDDVTVIPFLISGKKNSNDYRPTPASGEDAKRVIGKLNADSGRFGLEFDQNGKIKQ